MKRKLLILSILFIATFFINSVFGQGTPELMYYKFDNKGSSSIPNLASNPPSGTTTATINGSISQGSSGTCGGTALVGSGTVSTTDYVDTKWTTSLTGSWTISFWTRYMDSSTNLFYIFSDLSSAAFRCFTGGVAGAGNILLRGGFTDVLITGGASKLPTVSTFVYDANAGYIYAYLNGKLVNSVSQSAITLSGTVPFMLSGYNSLAGLPSNGLMDEFRFYTHALTAKEVARLRYYGTTTTTTTLCGVSSFKSPSGKYTWTTPGTYKDTILNYGNCDSIMTFLFTGSNHTKGTIDPKACDFYVSPSNKFVWTKTGTYTDVIKNNTGCDSNLTINLTVNYTTSKVLNIKACNSYTSPSGKYAWTTSGIYEDTIPNKKGCDSLITINLSLGSATSKTLNEKACDKYISPSKKRTWTISGIYKDTIVNKFGCDSLLTINLTVGYSTSKTINETACNNYKSPSGKTGWVFSGTYMDTIPNLAGCDSLITVNLTFNKSSFAQIIPEVCDSYISPSGKYKFNKSNSFFDTIPNKVGCDSIILIDLKVNPKKTYTFSKTVCNRFLSPSGKYVWKVSGKYTDTIPTKKGCDSIITINLTVNSVNVVVNQYKTLLSALYTGGTYQWMSCNTAYTKIIGATNQSYTVTAVGKYAVEISDGLCTDTSVCLNISSLSIDKNNFTNYFSVYPNPASGQFSVSSAMPFNNATIKIMNTLGETVLLKNNVDGNNVNLDISNHANGIYFIEITEKENSGRIKLIKY